MLEFFELEEKNGYVSLYENHITINKSLMEYLKEAYRDFNRYHRINYDDDKLEIDQKLQDFIKAFHSSSSPEFKKFGNTLSNWQIEIINSFTYINNWRLSNAKNWKH